MNEQEISSLEKFENRKGNYSVNINLEYYKIFYYAAKYGGITLAAEQLCISQPAVSQAVKQLEKAFGTVLFIRTPKGVRLTPEGEVLYTYVRQGYELIELGNMKLYEMMNMESGEIRVGASDMTLKFWLLPYLERFHEQYPKIKVTVTNGPTPETLEYLNQGRIDFGIVTSPVEEKADFRITKAREIEDIFVAGLKFAEWKEKPIDYKQLTELPMICLEKNTSTRHYIDDYLAKSGVALTPEFELATSDMIAQFAFRNLGIGCIVKDFADQYLNAGELFELKLKTRIPRRNMCIVSSRRNPISNSAKRLLDMLLEAEKSL